MRIQLQAVAAACVLVMIVAGMCVVGSAFAQPAPRPPIAVKSLPQQPCPSGYIADGTNPPCVPYAYLPGGTLRHPNENTACPPGSHKTMGPVLCFSNTGPAIIAPIAPAAATLSFTGFPAHLLSGLGIALALGGALTQLLARRKRITQSP